MKRIMPCVTMILAAMVVLPLTTTNAGPGKKQDRASGPVEFTMTAGYDYFGDFYHVFTCDGAVEDFGEVTTYDVYDEQGERIGRVWVLWGQLGTVEILDHGSQVFSERSWGPACRVAGDLRNYTEKSRGDYTILGGDGAYEWLSGAGTYNSTYERTVDCQPYGPIISAETTTELDGSIDIPPFEEL